jgi:hypothetical protein
MNASRHEGLLVQSQYRPPTFVQVIPEGVGLVIPEGVGLVIPEGVGLVKTTAAFAFACFGASWSWLGAST